MEDMGVADQNEEEMQQINEANENMPEVPNMDDMDPGMGGQQDGGEQLEEGAAPM